MVTRTGRFIAIAALALAVVSTHANAQVIVTQSQHSQIGFTGGWSIDPEQGFVGVFWRTPDIGGRFHLRPGIEGGFSENLKLATINIDFLARFPIGTSGWDFVQGGGPAIVVARAEGFGDSDIGAGGSYIIGFAHDRGFLGEFRIGGGRVPSLKLTAGVAIGF